MVLEILKTIACAYEYYAVRKQKNSIESTTAPVNGEDPKKFSGTPAWR